MTRSLPLNRRVQPSLQQHLKARLRLATVLLLPRVMARPRQVTGPRLQIMAQLLQTVVVRQPQTTALPPQTMAQLPLPAIMVDLHLAITAPNPRAMKQPKDHPVRAGGQNISPEADRSPRATQNFTRRTAARSRGVLGEELPPCTIPVGEWTSITTLAEDAGWKCALVTGTALLWSEAVAALWSGLTVFTAANMPTGLTTTTAGHMTTSTTAITIAGLTFRCIPRHIIMRRHFTDGPITRGSRPFLMPGAGPAIPGMDTMAFTLRLTLYTRAPHTG